MGIRVEVVIGDPKKPTSRVEGATSSTKRDVQLGVGQGSGSATATATVSKSYNNEGENKMENPLKIKGDPPPGAVGWGPTSTVGAVFALIAAIGTIIAAAKANDTATVVGGVTALFSALTLMGGRFAQAIVTLRRILGPAEPSDGSQPVSIESKTVYASPSSIGVGGQLFVNGEPAGSQPDPMNPDPVDSKIEEAKDDDPLLTQLLDDSDPTGQGYVYKEYATPPVDHVDDEISVAQSSMNDTDALSVDPVPPEDGEALNDRLGFGEPDEEA